MSSEILENISLYCLISLANFRLLLIIDDFLMMMMMMMMMITIIVVFCVFLCDFVFMSRLSSLLSLSLLL